MPECEKSETKDKKNLVNDFCIKKDYGDDDMLPMWQK